MAGDSGTQYSDAGFWRRLAGEVDRLDPDAGRTLHAALARYTAPLRIQVAGRAGVGRGDVQRVLSVLPCAGESCAWECAAWESALVDVPGVPDPILDADVIVYVLPTRLDPTSAHPADRRTLDTLDSRRVIVVVAGDTPVSGLTVPVFAQEDPYLDATITDRVDSAQLRRLEDFVRTVAGIASSPQARDVIEAALEDAGVSIG